MLGSALSASNVAVTCASPLACDPATSRAKLRSVGNSGATRRAIDMLSPSTAGELFLPNTGQFNHWFGLSNWPVSEGKARLRWKDKSMSIARRVAPELPTLRRFARLVAGSQASGDAHVIATLEALSADPSILSPDLPARQALYKTFLRLWSSADPHRRLDSLDRGPGIAAKHNLRAINPLPRQAFLLHAVEGFLSPRLRRSSTNPGIA